MHLQTPCSVGLTPSYPWSDLISSYLNWTSAWLSGNLREVQHKLQPPFFTPHLISGQHFFSQVLQVPSFNTDIFFQAFSCVLHCCYTQFLKDNLTASLRHALFQLHVPLTRSLWHLFSALDKWVFSHTYLFTAVLKRLFLKPITLAAFHFHFLSLHFQRTNFISVTFHCLCPLTEKPANSTQQNSWQQLAETHSSVAAVGFLSSGLDS